MPHPRIRCRHCDQVIVVPNMEFSDRQSFEDSDIFDVHTFCPHCGKLNVWNKDEVINANEFPVSTSWR